MTFSSAKLDDMTSNMVTKGGLGNLTIRAKEAHEQLCEKAENNFAESM